MKKNNTDDKDDQKETVDNQQFEAVEEQVELEEDSDLLQKLEESEAKYKRALADYQNLEKRALEDRREWIRSANKDILLRLLPVLDTLILAAKHDKNATLDISIGQFSDILKNEGVVMIETVGKAFDPQVMECVTMVEGEDGKVVEEVRAGYILGEKLLRPAQVLVGEKE